MSTTYWGPRRAAYTIVGSSTTKKSNASARDAASAAVGHARPRADHERDDGGSLTGFRAERADATTRTVRVVLVAEKRLLREALARVLNKRSDITVLESLSHGDDVEPRIATLRPDVLLCDALSAAPFDIRLVQSIARRDRRMKVVLIGMEEDAETFLAAVRAGIAGYVLNEASAIDVVNAVRAVARGEAVCPPRLVAELLAHVAQQSDEGPLLRAHAAIGLSRREQQLVPLIAYGLTNKEIAAQLGLSEQTVKNHIHRMLRKTGVTDRLAIVERCRQQGLPV